jgi:hypothetical protein
MNRRDLSSQDPIKTILVITVSFVVVYLFTKWKWTLDIAVIIGVLGVLSNFIVKKINLVWMKIIWILSLIVPNILLLSVYCFFLLPLAYLSKFFSAQNQIKLKNTDQSMFIERKNEISRNSFHKMW